MSLTFPTGIQQKPSGLSGLPNRFSRPSFGTIYGFDAVGGDVVDGVLLAENGDFLITESGDYLEVETATNTYTNSSGSFSVTINGYVGDFSWNAITNAVSYRVVIGPDITGASSNGSFNINALSRQYDMTNLFSPGSFTLYALIKPQYVDSSFGPYEPPITFSIPN